MNLTSVRALEAWRRIAEVDILELHMERTRLTKVLRGLGDVVMALQEARKDDQKRIDFLEDRVGYLESRLEEVLAAKREVT